MQLFNDILIVGFGELGKRLYNELKIPNIDIRDPYIPEYCNYDNKPYNVAFVCVPTPTLDDGSVDISHVEDAVKNTRARIIVIKSTVPVGTCEYLKDKYEKTIVASPDISGNPLQTPLQDFVVLGGPKKSCDKIAEIYYQIKDSDFRIKITDYKTAELFKYMDSAFMALKVTFCNEFADMAKAFGVSYADLRELFISDSRINPSHTFVNTKVPFYDSKGLNKDIPALIKQGQISDSEFILPLIRSMKEVNTYKRHKLVKDNKK